MSATIPEAASNPPAATRHVAIDFHYLDLAACDRCGGTDANLDAALAEVSGVLAAAGVEVSVRRTLVGSAEQARAPGFVSSPTIRVNGSDIAVELRESRCEAEACACNGAIDCRVWVWQGRESTAAPPAMIVDAVLRAAYAAPVALGIAPLGPAELPDNLERFFASKARAAGATTLDCCSAAEQSSCCEPSAKASCCGDASASGCGCR